MALVEVELRRATFEALLQLITSAAPTPEPTLSALGPDRLITGIQWASVTVGPAPPGYLAPAGMLTARAQATVSHISVDELESDPLTPPARASTTAWLLVSLSAARPTDLVVSLLQVDIDAGVTSFPVPVRLGLQSVAPSSLAASSGSMLVLADDVVTIRFASSPADELMLRPANRLLSGGGEGDWLVRVDGQVFVEQVLGRLRDATDPPPAGAVVEDAPVAAWTDHLTGAWRVVGGVGLLKEDACPGVFGDVDISLGVTVQLSLVPDIDAVPTRLGLRLSVASNVSDWDSLRCWAGTGGLAGVLGEMVTPFLGFTLGLGSLIGISEKIRLAAGEEVAGSNLGGAMTEVGRTSTSADYEGTMPLPAVGNTVLSADVGPDGLLVRGNLLLLGATHRVSFQPNSGVVAGSWHGFFSCRQDAYRQEYLLPSVQISDEAQILGKRFAAVPVRVFPTSRVVPAGGWTIRHPVNAEVNQHVDLVSADDVAGRTARAYVHTSAGIRRYDLGPVPEPPAAPDALTQSLMRVNCRSSTKVWTRLEQVLWLVDPPAFDYGRPPLRQWQITVDALPAGARVTLQHSGEGGSPVTFTAGRDGPATLEVVTRDDAEIALDHNLESPPEGTRLTQRWLLPLHAVDLGGPAVSLRRQGTDIEVLTEDRRIIVSALDWSVVATERRPEREARSSETIFSLTFPDRSVAVAHGNELVVAAIYGR